jgi:hypothetical protein
MLKDKKILFNFRIHKELYDYISKKSKDNYTTMTQYIIDLIKKDKEKDEK